MSGLVAEFIITVLIIVGSILLILRGGTEAGTIGASSISAVVGYWFGRRQTINGNNIKHLIADTTKMKEAGK